MWMKKSDSNDGTYEQLKVENKHVSKQTSLKQKWRKNYKCLALSITGLRTVISTHDISKIAIKCKLTTDIAIL